MKIQIIKSDRKLYWYSTYVGKIFKVEDTIDYNANEPRYRVTPPP